MLSAFASISAAVQKWQNVRQKWQNVFGMGRPQKTLLARVLENRFRPGRYGELLASEPLPREPPFRDERRRELWQELLRVQRRYRTEPSGSDVYYFSRLIRALHGAPTPLHYRRGGARLDALIESALARVTIEEPDAAAGDSPTSRASVGRGRDLDVG